MSQQTKITKVLEQLKNAEDKHTETIDSLGENIGVYMADISNSISEMTQVMMMSLTNTSALLEDVMVNGSVANDILLDQLLEGRNSGGISGEENEREDDAFKEGLSDRVDDIHDELKDGNKDRKDEKKGFFRSLMGVGAMIFGKLMSAVLKPLSFLKSGAGFLKTLFGKSGVLGKIFGKGGMIAKVFGKGGTIATIVGKFGKLTGLTALFGRLAPMLSILGKIFVPLGLVITGFKVISAAIEDFMAGGDPASIISAGIGAFVEFFTFGFLKKDQVKGAIEGPIRSTIDFFVDVFHAVSDFVSGTIMPFVQTTVIPAIQSAFSAVVGFFQDHIIPFITETLIPYALHIFNNVIMPIVGRLFETFKKVFEVVKTYIMIAWEISKPIIMSLIEFVTGTVIPFITDTVIPVAMNIINTVWNIIDWLLTKILDFMFFLAESGVFDGVVAGVFAFINLIIDTINMLTGAISTIWDAIIGSLIAVNNGMAAIKRGVAKFVYRITPPGTYTEKDFKSDEAEINADRDASNATLEGMKLGDSLKISNVKAPETGIGEKILALKKDDASAIDTREIEAQKQQAAAPSVVNNNVTNVQGGSGGGGGGAIIAPSATRMNESSFRTQTQNGMVPAMEG